jgi:radical SAM protein with 4Fe4S-binding SPASM domain
MKKLPPNYKVQRMHLQLRRSGPTDLAKTCLRSFLGRLRKKSLRFPSTVLVEVTNDCMLNCVMCPRSKLKEPTGYMSFDLFADIVEECSHHGVFEDLILSGFGEPLLHPQLLRLTRFAKEKGIPKVRLITNAALLTQTMTSQLLENSGLDQIGLSLDALTHQTYRSVKGSENFEAVQENIAHFLERKNREGRWKPFVSLHILKMRETVFEIRGFVEKWSPRLGKGDHILVKDVHSFAGQVDDKRLEEQLSNGERLPCRQLWRLLYVSWDGEVMPCCLDGSRQLRIGNLHGSSLEQLWKSPRIREIRRIHIQKLYDNIPLCSQCENWWYLGKQPKRRQRAERR